MRSAKCAVTVSGGEAGADRHYTPICRYAPLDEMCTGSCDQCAENPLRPATSTASFLLDRVETAADDKLDESIGFVGAPGPRHKSVRLDHRLLDEAMERLDDDQEDLVATLDEAIDDLVAVN